MLLRLLCSILTLVLAAALLVGCGGDEDGAGDDDDRRSATTETEPEPEPEPEPEDAEPTGGPQADAEFSATVAGGAVQGGPQAFRVKVGDNVAITIASDVADEAHLHGIDTDIAIPAGGEATLRFMPADQGSYELEMHETGALVGTVVVE